MRIRIKTENRKTVRFAAACWLGVLLLAGVPALADGGGPASAHARFGGASYDGYDQGQELRTTTDWTVFRARLTRRFRGGAYGGYAQATALGETRLAKGSMFMFR